MDFFSNFKKNRAIKSYIKKLPPLLSRAYGHSQKYAPEQINEASKYLGLNFEHIGYAYAILSTRDDFNSYVGKAGLKIKFNHLRKEVADKYFGGQTNFKIFFPKTTTFKRNADNSLRNHYFRNH